MTKPDFSRSDALYERARQAIPGGIFGHYGSAVRERGPKFFARSEGAYFWDVDGNRYIDYMCAYGPMVLGYNHPAVDAAADAQQRLGHAVSLAPAVMVELAERLVEQVAGADWALFGKNGGDATTLAVMIARAATGRKIVVKVRGGYHGVAAWTRDGRAGAIDDDAAQVAQVDWNDADEFERLIDAHPGEIACFISSPYHHPALADSEMPAEGYWPRMESLCRDNGIVLISDDVRAGFRSHLAGSHAAFGYTPDLACFGKAIANGHPLAALTGTDALRETAREVFYTGTQFFSGAPMAAALATLDELAQCDAVTRMNAMGAKLNAGLVAAARNHGFELKATGAPSMPYYRIANVPTREHFAWIDECVQRGVYLLGFHNHFLSTAHTDEDLERTWEAADAAFAALAQRQ